MFADEPRDVDLAHLRFLRWLAERGWLEHGPAGPPAGLYASRPVANAAAPWNPIGQDDDPPIRVDVRNARRAML
jgi:hypothetical protein